jgi:hypothetical protein
MRVLIENTTFLLHKIIRIAGIIRVAGIIRGWALYEEMRWIVNLYKKNHLTLGTLCFGQFYNSNNSGIEIL